MAGGLPIRYRYVGAYMYGQSSGTPKVWFDDVTLYAVSMAQSYDRQGNLSEAMGPDGARVVYRRDRFGRVVAVVDPRGRITTMSYDSLGRPLRVTDPLGNVTEYSYDNVGNLSSFTDPLTNTMQYAYANASYQGLEVRPVGGSLQCCFPRGFTNNDNSLSTTTLYGLNASSVWVAAEHDANGNLTLAVTSNASGAPTMDVRSNPTWSGTDPINNLNQIKRQDITTDALFDVVPFDFAQFDASGGGLTTWRYTYDASGNMTQKTDGTNTWTYQWDEDNRLVLVTLPSSATIAYAYDAAGRMLERTDSMGTTQFEWDGFDCVREMAPATGTALFDTAHFDGGDTFGSSGETQYYVVGGRMLRFVRDGVPYAVVSDALGSVRLVLDPSGAVVAHFEYDAWGNVLGSSSDGVPWGIAYRYVGTYGCRWDEDTGLIYMRARWYSAENQRFISRDPIGLEGGINLYAYVGDSPTTEIDPFGLVPPGSGAYQIPAVELSGKQTACPNDAFDKCMEKCQKHYNIALSAGGAATSVPTQGVLAALARLGGTVPVLGTALRTGTAANPIRGLALVSAAGLTRAGCAVSCGTPAGIHYWTNDNSNSVMWDVVTGETTARARRIFSRAMDTLYNTNIMF